MNTAIIVVSILAGAFGLILAGWSIVNTRKKYYEDFLKRTSVREKLRLPR